MASETTYTPDPRYVKALPPGEIIVSTGDVANFSKRGVVVDVYATRWGTLADIVWFEGADIEDHVDYSPVTKTTRSSHAAMSIVADASDGTLSDRLWTAYALAEYEKRAAEKGEPLVQMH